MKIACTTPINASPAQAFIENSILGMLFFRIKQEANSILNVMLQYPVSF
jgi:hypothetical protein